MQRRPTRRRGARFSRFLTALLLAGIVGALPGAAAAKDEGTNAGAAKDAAKAANGATKLKVHTFDALGGTWVAHHVKWTEIDGKWLIGAVVQALRSSGNPLTGPEMIDSFCGEIVKAKPMAPSKKIGKNDIFRVDIVAGNADGKLFWPIPVPVRVRGGECQVRGDTQQFSVRYTGDLDGWRLAGGGLRKAGDGWRHQLVFEPDARSAVRLGDFDYEHACRATLKDPTVKALQAVDAKRHKGGAIEPDVVVIVARTAGKNGLSFDKVFSTAGGKCVQRH